MNETIQGALIAMISFGAAKGFDYLVMQKTHSLSLKKEYFLKKLNAFENATSYYTIAHITLRNIAIIYKSITKDDVDFPEETIKEMLREVKDGLKSVYDRTQNYALALTLYSDIKFDDQDELDSEKFYDLLGQISWGNSMIELYYKNITPENKERADELIEEEMGKIKGIIEEMDGLSKKIKARYKILTAQLRLELKKYDN